MLKPAEPGPPPPERPIGELVHELVDEGKAYAQAEVELAKAIAAAKARALAVPAALFGICLIVALAAVTALALGLVLALAKFLGPLLAGIVGMAIFAAIAGLLAWIAVGRVKRAL
jgi:uncharacterized RDD family membrane protein YckC